jgi:hypothetical protein
MAEPAIKAITSNGGRLQLEMCVDAGWMPPKEMHTMTSTELQHFFDLAPKYMEWVRSVGNGITADKYKEVLERQLDVHERRIRNEYTVAIAQKDARLVVLNAQVESVAEAKDNMYQGIVAAKESMIGYLKDRVKELETVATSRVKVQQNASLRGRAGEDSFEDMATSLGWTIRRTAGESHMCDFKGVVCGIDVFFEIKNHEETIPSKELTKFRRDMKEHPEVAAGVFIGLKAPVARGERWHLEWTTDRRPMIFIGELEKDDSISVLRIVEKFLNVCSVMRSGEEISSEVTVSGLEQRIKTASAYLEATGGRLRTLYNKMVVDKGAAEAAYIGSLALLKSLREEHESTVGTLLGTLTFSCDEGLGAAATATATATAKKRKRQTATTPKAPRRKASITEDVAME